MNDKSSHPALADQSANIVDYDTILLGFPIRWYVAPTIINTFLESYGFSGKKIVLFATSGGERLWWNSCRTERFRFRRYHHCRGQAAEW